MAWHHLSTGRIAEKIANAGQSGVGSYYRNRLPCSVPRVSLENATGTYAGLSRARAQRRKARQKVAQPEANERNE